MSLYLAMLFILSISSQQKVAWNSGFPNYRHQCWCNSSYLTSKFILRENFNIIYGWSIFRAHSKAPNWGLPKPRAHQSNLKAVFRDLRQSTQFTTGWNNLWRSIAYVSARVQLSIWVSWPDWTKSGLTSLNILHTKKQNFIVIDQIETSL